MNRLSPKNTILLFMATLEGLPGGLTWLLAIGGSIIVLLIYGLIVGRGSRSKA